MTRTEYVERVLSVMRHVTPSEREAIRAEIDAHIEDHICALMGLDYDEALAEERTMVRMGDPEEVGRELDKQYTNAFWLWLEGIAKILLAPMILVALLGIGILFHAVDHLEARFAPAQGSTEDFTEEAMEETDYCVTVGNDVLKVYQVSVGNKVFSYYSHNQIAEQGPAAELLVCAYDRIPFGIVSGDLFTYLKAADQRGKEIDTWGGGAGSWGAEYNRYYIPVEPGDTCVTLSYDRFGESVTLKVPLPEVTP
jgi:hypothetical protein